MPVKPKKSTSARTAETAKKRAAKAIAKKARKATKPAKKPKTTKMPAAKKAIAKTTPGKKAAKQQGKPASIKTSTKNAANKPVTKTPSERAAWKISPEISQSVVDVDIWKKGDLTIEHLTVYRSGWIIVDELPDLSDYNPDEGVNIFEEFEFKEHQFLDESEETSIFPKELPAEECERLTTLSDAELVSEGWIIESATRFIGPLVVEEV